MGRFPRISVSAALSLIIVAASVGALADETSTGDKLRILYSNRFTFDDRGIPLITVEIMSGQEQVELSSKTGLAVLPDGDGGARVDGGTRWKLTVEHARPAVIREWTVVARLGAEDQAGASSAIRLWRTRGFKPRRFEVGTVFGVEGEVIDSRALLVAVAPVTRTRGGTKSRAIAKKFKVKTSVHAEMTRRPSGTIVARSGALVIRNPSVLWFRPRGSDDTITVENVLSGHGGSQLTTHRERRRYWGSVYVALDSSGKLVAVNAIAADRLLAGLVPSEIFPSAAAEALAAQAIAARTELLEKIGTRHLTDPYLLCSSQHCQVYSGAGHEHKRTTRAVQQTRGQLLLRDSGGLVDARYSASCGGHGANNDHIWGDPPDPSLRGAIDAAPGSPQVRRFSRVTDSNIGDFLALPADAGYCGQTRFGKGRYRWIKKIDTKKLSARVEAQYKGVGVVRQIVPLHRGKSGRISRLKIVGTQRALTVSGDLHIRRLLGGLRSTLFTVQGLGPTGQPTAFEFRGAGFGHGVGMCQTGAIGMAERGAKHGAILGHYYRGSHIKRLY